MSSRPDVGSLPLPRDRIAAIVGTDPRIVKWFESLILAVQNILPDAAMTAQDTADSASIAATAARLIAEEAIAQVADQMLAPPGVHAELAALRSRIEALERGVIS